MPETTGGYTSEQLDAELAELELPTFSPAEAVALGLLATDRAITQQLAIIIEVYHLGRLAYRAALPGSIPDSDDWLARKRRTVERYQRSTLATKVKYEERGTTFNESTGPERARVRGARRRHAGVRHRRRHGRRLLRVRAARGGGPPVPRRLPARPAEPTTPRRMESAGHPVPHATPVPWRMGSRSGALDLLARRATSRAWSQPSASAWRTRSAWVGGARPSTGWSRSRLVGKA